MYYYYPQSINQDKEIKEMVWKNTNPEKIREYNRKYYEEKTKAKRKAKREKEKEENPIYKICPLCGTKFKATTRKQKYCCEACQLLGRKIRMKVYREQPQNKEKAKKYRQTEAYKRTRAKYMSSEKGKESLKRYQQSEKGKEAAKRYQQSEKGKEATKRANVKRKIGNKA